MIFKMYNCDFGIKVNGLRYDFEHVKELQIEDPERNRLTRGGNGTSTTGLTYREGLKEPKRWTIPIMNMSQELKAVLDECYTNQTRVECYCIDRNDGSSKMAKNAVLSNRPQQLTLDDSAESMNVSLEFETFDSSEVHKS
jgi:hypothetical protein